MLLLKHNRHIIIYAKLHFANKTVLVTTRIMDDSRKGDVNWAPRPELTSLD